MTAYVRYMSLALSGVFSSLVQWLVMSIHRLCLQLAVNLIFVRNEIIFNPGGRCVVRTV